MFDPKDLKDIPPEVLEEMGINTSEQDLEVLENLASTISSLRKEAIDERRASGIEEVWLAAEEAYIGMDDANRGEFSNARWSKPMAMNGPLTSDSGRRDAVKSTAFCRITSRYVDAGAAKLSEISLPIDGKAFSLTPVSDPELVKSSEDSTPAMIQGAPVMNKPEEDGGQPTPATVGDVAQHDMQVAMTKAEKAEDRILGWMQQSKFRAEMRKVNFDGSRIGTGILKGPFPMVKSNSSAKKTDDGYEIEIINKVFPGVKWADPWNFYPDASCGDDVHNGEYCFELDYLSRRKLRELKKDKSFLKKQIDKVLEDGPDNSANDSRNPNEKSILKDKRFKVWHFYGTVKRKDFEVACADKKLAEGVDDEVFAIVTMVNETVIKASINPSPSGKFPYRIFNWQRRAGSWAGIGVGEQISMPQRAVNGSVRAMFDNAGISSGVQIVLDRGSIEPADGEWVIGRNKLWWKSADATIDDVRKAFATFEIPSLQVPLMAIIDWGMKQAEECTSIPLVTQGFSGTNSPDTYGAAMLQNNNANQLLRDIGHRLDDSVTEPMIHEYYDYLLLDTEVPDDEKGAFDIDAHGTSSLVERFIQAQEIAQFMQLSLNPAYELDPALVAEQMLLSKHFDASKFKYTPEKLAQMAKQQTPMAPVVEAAQVRSQAMIQIAQAKDQTLQAIAQTKEQTTQAVEQARNDRDAQYQNSMAQRDAQNAQVQVEKLAIMRDQAALNERIAILDANLKKGISTDAIKADLASTSAKLQVEERLAMTALSHGKAPAMDAPIQPPVQLPGRAPDGHAFEQV